MAGAPGRIGRLRVSGLPRLREQVGVAAQLLDRRRERGRAVHQSPAHGQQQGDPDQRVHPGQYG